MRGREESRRPCTCPIWVVFDLVDPPERSQGGFGHVASLLGSFLLGHKTTKSSANLIVSRTRRLADVVPDTWAHHGRGVPQRAG
jgi:hypothetical protein